MSNFDLTRVNAELGHNAQGLVEWALALSQPAIVTTNFRPFEAVLDTYRAHRNTGENFIDTLRRVGQDPFKLAANAARTSTARAPRVAAEV